MTEESAVGTKAPEGGAAGAPEPPEWVHRYKEKVRDPTAAVSTIDRLLAGPRIVPAQLS